MQNQQLECDYEVAVVEAGILPGPLYSAQVMVDKESKIDLSLVFKKFRVDATTCPLFLFAKLFTRPSTGWSLGAIFHFQVLSPENI